MIALLLILGAVLIVFIAIAVTGIRDNLATIDTLQTMLDDADERTIRATLNDPTKKHVKIKVKAIKPTKDKN